MKQKINSYFHNHPGYQSDTIDIAHKSMCKKFSVDLLRRGVSINADTKVLEIGVGNGNFAYFCHTIGVKEYLGIDIDSYFFDYLGEKITNYSFLEKTFQDHFATTANTYDLIFTSHLFEHLDENERIELVAGISNKLNQGGLWINYMPNADSILKSTSMRYCDITYKNLYNYQSFEQVIKIANGDFSTIRHLNDNTSNILLFCIHKAFLVFTKIYYMGMMQGFPRYYSTNLITILTK